MKTKTKAKPAVKPDQSEQALEALQTMSKALQSINFSLAAMERRQAKVEGIVLDYCKLVDAANPTDPTEILVKLIRKNYGI